MWSSTFFYYFKNWIAYSKHIFFTKLQNNQSSKKYFLIPFKFGARKQLFRKDSIASSTSSSTVLRVSLSKYFRHREKGLPRATTVARQKSIPNIYRLNIHYFITQWLSRGKTKWMKNSNGTVGESSSTTVNHHQIASTELPFDFSVCVRTRFFFRGGKTHWKAGLHLIFLWGSWKSVARLENVYILKGGCKWEDFKGKLIS